MTARALSPIERVLARVVVDVRSGCWVWTGSSNGTYGTIQVGSRRDGTLRRALVHRLVWEHYHGPIRRGLVIDHVRRRGCVSTRCCNPDHLEPVTSGVNNRRGVGWSGANASATHCPRGHPYAGGNLVRRPSGRRGCRACDAARARRRRAAKRSAG